MICPGCEHENRENAQFCGECGEPLRTETLCPQCGSANPTGQKFCDSCGRRLAQLTEGRPEREPRAYTPQHLADKILHSKSALEGERKQVTILFADVKGSMELAEQVDPEEWHRILDRFFQILADGVHRFEGTVNQYTGDGIMALFGAPIAHEDHAQRGCWAALHLREELRHYARELKREQGLGFSVRMGINSGEVVVGKIGDDLRMDYTAQGHTVGLAARMQELAESGSVYLAEQSADLVEGFFDLEDLGCFSLKGSREPLRVFQLEGAGPLRTRFDVSRARGLSHFVGRVEELAGLDAALERARQGRGPVVGVVAEAGVGKSRLCFEFAERCRARGMSVLEAHAVAHGKRIALLPMLELFRGFFRITDSDSDRGAREKIAGRLTLLDEELRRELPLVFDLLGVPDPERPLPEMEADARQHRIFTVLKRIIRASAQRETTVTLVEDLHWMDAASDALLEQMVEAMEGTRGLLLVNFRPEYHARWMQRSNYQQLPLMPLGPDAVHELLGSLLGEDSSVVLLPELIHERTEGNPFFIEEVVRTLVEAGHLEGRAGAYRLSTPVEDVAIPPTVQAVLAARIDRLADEPKQLLQTASVVGKIFSARMLGALAGLPEADLSAALSSLRDAEFLYEETLYPEVEYAFRHPLTQEVAYGSQLQERRVWTHAAVARAVEELEPDKLDERAALIAHHWEAAGETIPAARWNHRAARWAGDRHPGESLRHWRKVASLLRDAEETEETGELEVEACRWILRLALELGADPDEAAEIFERGLALAEARGDLERQVILTAVYGWFLGASTGDVAPELEYARKAAALAKGLQEPIAGTIAGVEWGFADSLSRGGDVRAAQEVNRRYFKRVPTAPEGRGGLGFHSRLVAQQAYYAASTGHLAEGIEQLEQLLREQRARRPDSSDVALHFYVVLCQEIAGDAEAAMASARAGVALAERTGAPRGLVYAYHMLGMAHVLRDAMAEAVGWLERAVGLVRESRIALSEESHILASLAEARAGVGELVQARRTAERSIDLSRQRHSGVSEIFGLLALVRVLLLCEDTGTHGTIEQAVSAGADLVKSSGMLALQPAIQIELGELARQRGDDSERERQLRKAQQLFTDMGAPIRVAQIARELES